MFIRLDRGGTAAGLERMLEEAEEHGPTQGIMILACDANNLAPDAIDRTLNQCAKPIFGGIFPRILFQREILERGTLVVGINHPVSTKTIGDMGRRSGIDTELGKSFPLHTLKDHTMFTFIDGLSENISGLVESAFNNWGLLPNYIGGGAGSLTFRQKPCIFTNQGLLVDAAVFALIETRSGIGVAHGWKPVHGPLKVTAAEQNAIITLNLRPAYEVYAETVAKISGQSFADTDFFQLAKQFPFGIVKVSDEMVVRDPIKRDGNRVVCVGEVPRDSFVYILQGDRESLIAGAARARRLAEETYRETIGAAHGETNPTTVFVDCISRVLFLGPDFTAELEAVHTGHPLLGALTLGEIANTGKSYLEFYNKTSVVALLEG